MEEEINGFANYEDRYLEILSEVEGLRNEQSMSQAMVPAGGRSLSHTRVRELRLENIRLPVFSGSGKDGEIDFSEFIDIFTRATLDHSDQSRILLLKANLCMPASGCLGGLRLIGENYKVMLERLKAKYGNPTISLNQYLRKLVEYKGATSADDNTTKNLRRRIDELSAITANLRQIDPTALTSESIILSLVRLKLPREITIELSVKGELSDATTIDGLFEAIEQSCRSREIADMASGWGSNKSADKQNFRQKERVHMVSKKNPQKEKKNDAPSQECVLCKSKSHPTKSCTNPTVPSKDRFKAVMNGNLCSYCLRVGHKKMDCFTFKKQQYTCNKCGSKNHHSLMHLEASQKPTSAGAPMRAIAGPDAGPRSE